MAEEPLDAARDEEEPALEEPVLDEGHATVRRARQRYGLLGAAMAGAMVALRDLLEKPKDKAAVVVEAASEPVDLDADGVTVPLDEGVAAKAPPQHRPVSDPDAAREWTRQVLARNRRRR